MSANSYLEDKKHQESKCFNQSSFGHDICCTYNVSLAHEIGVQEAIVLNDLIDQDKYFESQNMKIVLEDYEGEWFHYTSSRCHQRTAISKKQLQRIVQSLKSLNIITYVTKGLPAKRHIQINYIELFKIIENITKSDQWKHLHSRRESSLFLTCP